MAGGKDVLGGLPLYGSPRSVVKLGFSVLSDLYSVEQGGTNNTSITDLIDGAGGGILLTYAGVENNETVVRSHGEIVRFNKLNDVYNFQWVMSVSQATQVDWFLGLGIGACVATAPGTDCLGIRKDDGDTNIDVTSLKNSAGTTDLAVGTFTAAHLDRYHIKVRTGGTLGVADIYYYRNGHLLKKQAGATICDDEELHVFAGVAAGDASVSSMTLRFMGWDVPDTTYGL